jgi:DNA polymerase-1
VKTSTLPLDVLLTSEGDFVLDGYNHPNLQLVRDYVKVAITRKGISDVKLYSREDVFEDMGVFPEHVVDYKGLAGDSSDNIPGVKGIGAKTASQLITQFGNLESIYEHLEEVSSIRIKGLLEEYREEAFLSKKLATIMQDIPAEFDLETYRFNGINRDGAHAMFVELEMSGLIRSMGFTQEEMHSELLADYTIAEDTDFDELIKKIKASGEMTFKTLSYKRNATDYEIECMAVLDGKSVYIVGDFNLMREVLEDPSIDKNGYVLKEDMLAFRSRGIELKGIANDLLISNYLLYPDRDSMDIGKLSTNALNFEITSLQAEAKKDKVSEEDLPKNVKENYLKNVMMLVDLMREKHQKELEENNLMKLYKEVEMPLIEVLANMEYVGFKVDMDQLDIIDVKVTKRIKELETLIYSYAMETFNINSPKQLGVILFDKLGLKVIKKTKTGYSTNHDVLMKLMGDHPIIELIIEYRTYSKLKSTYIDGFKQVINPQTQRVHSSFKQTVAVTGRLSSPEPNMQNIPIRLELGRELRKIFVASSKEYKLVDADYSQIELRILAHLSQDENLLRAYVEGIDIHALTASQVFDMPLEKVTSKERGEAKGVNFGIVYGISDYGLSENLGISRKKAKAYIENYFIKYPKVKQYLDTLITDCRKDGYVATLMGRKRVIPEINASNFMRRGFAERTAMNTPIQGSAADIMKVAMLKVHRSLKEHGLKAQLILQVHDELIIDAPLEELEMVKQILSKEMETAVELSISLDVDMNEGDSWYETK